jgi:hypothetical protein
VLVVGDIVQDTVTGQITGAIMGTGITAIGAGTGR